MLSGQPERLEKLRANTGQDTSLMEDGDPSLTGNVQNNNPAHVLCERLHVKSFYHPPQPLDPNPTEAVWYGMKKRLWHEPWSTPEEFRLAVMAAWKGAYTDASFHQAP